MLRALIDRTYTEHPEFGVRRIRLALMEHGFDVGQKRIRRCLHSMGLEAVYPKPRLTNPTGNAGRFPYLLRGVAISRPHQVWASDITYIPMVGGWAYLLAIIDWFSRYVLAWDVSSTRDGTFAASVLKHALCTTTRFPAICNTDQGSEFCDSKWIDLLKLHDVQISQDGRGRALDNRMVERLWRTVKWEHVYLHDYSTLTALRRGLTKFFDFYNNRRWHQGLGNHTPSQVLLG